MLDPPEYQSAPLIALPLLAFFFSGDEALDGGAARVLRTGVLGGVAGATDVFARAPSRAAVGGGLYAILPACFHCFGGFLTLPPYSWTYAARLYELPSDGSMRSS